MARVTRATIRVLLALIIAELALARLSADAISGAVCVRVAVRCAVAFVDRKLSEADRIADTFSRAVQVALAAYPGGDILAYAVAVVLPAATCRATSIRAHAGGDILVGTRNITSSRVPFERGFLAGVVWGRALQG